MFPNLLCIKYRLVNEAPIKDSLADIIRKDFFQPVSSFKDDLERVQLLQNSIAHASKSEDSPFEWLQNRLEEYYYLVKDILVKFPENCVTFTWYDTLGYKPRQCPATGWNKEQSQLIYQMGCLFSQKACNENSFTDDGLKQACSYFKLAAGCFDVLVNEQSDLKFLDDNTLLCLRSLMVAEAQEVVWLKAISNATMKNSVIARLSIKVSELYQVALKYAENSDHIILDWINHFKVKIHHFQAASHYRMAIVAQDHFEYGVQVAHLKHASECCTKAIQFKRYVNQNVVEDLVGLMDAVNTSYRSAEKDNDLVYLKPVPHYNELPEILGVSMVSIETPTFLKSRPETCKEVFKTLLPFRVIQVAQAFRERQDQFIIDKFQKPVHALSQLLNTFLTERDLPASIDTIQKPENLPDSIVHHAQEISSYGGIEFIELSMDEISKLRQNCIELVVSCEERLRMEKYEDDLLRHREGSTRWNRPSSDVVSSALYSRIDRMKGYLEQGKQSDNLIGQRYFSIQDKLKVYCEGYELLKRSIPCSTHVKVDPSVGKLLSELRQLLVDVEKMEANRHRFLSSIEIKSREHAILPVILNDFKRNPGKFQDPEGVIDATKFELFYEQHLKYFSSDLEYVEKLKRKQMELEEEIHIANVKFLEAKSISYDHSQKLRHDALQDFEFAYTQFLELISNLNDASKFYTDFMDRGNIVLRETEDFLYSRREEARELEISIRNQEKLSNIEQSMVSGNTPMHLPQAQKATRTLRRD